MKSELPGKPQPEPDCHRISRIDILFDFNDLGRIEPLNEFILKKETVKLVLIDHHLNPQIDAEWILHDTKACSTCELVYRLYEILEPALRTDQRSVGMYLYRYPTDTGFSNGATSKKALEITAHLLDCGSEHHLCAGTTEPERLRGKLRFIGNALSRNMIIREDIGIGIIIVDKKDVYRFKPTDRRYGRSGELSVVHQNVKVLIKQESKNSSEAKEIFRWSIVVKTLKAAVTAMPPVADLFCPLTKPSRRSYIFWARKLV